MKDGSAYWVEFSDGRIVFGDGRICGEDGVVHLPPCNPTRIICVHVNYISRYYEFNKTHTPPPLPAPRAAVGFPASPDSEGVRRVAGNEERLPDKFKAS